MNIREITDIRIEKDKLIYGVFTSPKNKTGNPYKKITVRPLTIKGDEVVQFEKFTDKQAFHENLDYMNAREEIIRLIDNDYKNINIFTTTADYQIISGKKGNIRITEKQPSGKIIEKEHNKKKQYIINEHDHCDFLELLGVMNKDGLVYAKKYDKFRQINKFLEIVDDTVKDKEINDDFMIVDFGCGKAYLTFALYYYFYKIRNIKVKITGLDLKEEVINHLNEVAKKLNYENLNFICGDIRDFEYSSNINMVVTLHACDTATDASLVKAIKWNADIILSVPCCQHELFDKINNDHLEPMLKHGLIKERISSLVTDSLRGLFLETKGYKVQLTEFIEMEHTPKNILIKAFKTGKINNDIQNEYEEFKEFWNLKDLFIDNYYNK